MTMRAALLTVFMLAAGCSYRPARFADRPPVTTIEDRPIAVPEPTPFVEAAYLSDVYLRRPVIDALDAERFVYAKDVNALDDVPRSSFWDPPPLEPEAFLRAYSAKGRPEPPLTKRDDGQVLDRRGRVYSVHADPPGLAKTHSAAAIIASRLARAIGYRTEEIWPYAGGALVREPAGIPLGATHMSGTRPGDPNDRIEHRDRRTLRALVVLAAWLEIRDLGPERLVDVYVGKPGRGRVQHFLVNLDDAFGTGSLSPSRGRETAAGTVRGGTLENLVTLGLVRPNSGEPREKSLRAFSPRLSDEWELAHPWEPVDRLLPSDGYWMAKRIGALPSRLIERAVDQASLPVGVREHVIHALEARRTTLIARWFREVTPLEPHSLHDSGRLELADEAIRLGYADASRTRYRVTFLGDHGEELAPVRLVRPSGHRLVIELSPELLARSYVVVRVVGERGEASLPRGFEAHVSMRGAPHVVGVRH